MNEIEQLFRLISGGAVFLMIIGQLIPIVAAIIAVTKAERFKTLVFVVTYYEWFGWVLCITIVGIPAGLALVLLSQSVRVLIQVEKNTAQLPASTINTICNHIGETDNYCTQCGAQLKI